MQRRVSDGGVTADRKARGYQRIVTHAGRIREQVPFILQNAGEYNCPPQVKTSHLERNVRQLIVYEPKDTSLSMLMLV